MTNKYNLLTDALSYLDRKISPVNSQPVGILVNLIGTVGNNGTDESLNYLTSGPNSVDGDYGTTKSTIAKNISRVLNNALYVARNKINPLINQVIEHINLEKQKENDITLASGLYDRDIVTVSYPNLLSNPTFLNIIDESSSGLSSYSEREYNDIIQPLIGIFTSDEIKFLMSTGISELDTQVLGLLGKNYDFNIIRSLSSELFNRNVWELTGIFFTLYGISNNRLEKVEFFTSNSNNKQVLDYAIRYVASMIRSLINIWEHDIKSETIIISNSKLKPYHLFNSKGTTPIFTNEIPYTNWLNENNGSPEAIYGFCYSLKDNLNSSVVSEQNLKSNQDLYVKFYNDKLNINKSLINDNIIKAINNALLNTIQKSINEESDDVLKTKYTNCYISKVKPYDGTIDVHSYIRNSICDTFTDGETVKFLLADTDTYLKNTNSTDIDLARRNAIMNTIVKWLSSQVMWSKL